MDETVKPCKVETTWYHGGGVISAFMCRVVSVANRISIDYITLKIEC